MLDNVIVALSVFETELKSGVSAVLLGTDVTVVVAGDFDKGIGDEPAGTGRFHSKCVTMILAHVGAVMKSG